MTEDPVNLPVEAEDDNYDDADSAVGASIASSTTSINSSILAYREENGRTYHAYKDGIYAFPNDESENNRLDMQHHLFALTLHGKLYLSPLDEKKLHRVLDLGTGTGIWAIDFADMHAQSEVLGVDLSPIQPSFVPPNLRFEVDDIESHWNYNRKFDFIYARQMTGSIENWPKLFKQSFDNLNPGGYIEIFDNIHPPRCDDGTMPNDWPVKKWSELLLKTLKEKMNRSLESALDYESQLKEAGFVNVVVKEYMWPICRWPKDKHLKELGLWASEQVSGGAEGLSQAVCCRMCGWSAEELQVFLVSIRKELRNTKVHAYWPLLVCYAQKPLDSTSS